MAHLAHYKRSAVGMMLGHYERAFEKRGFERENIDARRIADNYRLGGGDVRSRIEEAARRHHEATGKKVRKDANVFSDWVVTLPKDCPRERAREFFKAVFGFVQARYGAENAPVGYVHMDEATPHIHVPVVPFADGRLSAKAVFTRADLKSFHGDLGKAVDAALGFHVSVELDERQRGEKQLSVLNQDEYVAARRRLESLRIEIEEKESEPAGESIAESVRTLAASRDAGSRERDAAAENARLRSRIRGLERDCGAARSRIERLRGRIEGLRRQIAERLEERARRTPLADRFARAKAHSAAAERVSRPRTHQRARGGWER